MVNTEKFLRNFWYWGMNNNSFRIATLRDTLFFQYAVRGTIYHQEGILFGSHYVLR